MDIPRRLLRHLIASSRTTFHARKRFSRVSDLPTPLRNAQVQPLPLPWRLKQGLGMGFPFFRHLFFFIAWLCTKSNSIAKKIRCAQLRITTSQK